MEYKFVDHTGVAVEPMKLIAPFVIPKEAMDAVNSNPEKPEADTIKP